MEQFTKRKHAFLFQGVGVEYKKFLHLLDDEQKELLKYYCSVVYDEIELDLWNYLYNSTPGYYCDMFSDSIAIYTIDYIVYNTYIKFGIKPEVFLGYSMGLITAIACGKSISFETGLQIQLYVYRYFKYASHQEEAMAVIIGMTCDCIEKIIKENNLSENVEIGSENNSYCIVISGSKAGVEKVMAIAEHEGAMKIKKVNAPYAFHSHYAVNGIEKYIKYMSKIQISDCMIPVISIFNQNIIQDSFELKRELIKNMSSRMYWKTSMERVSNMGINSFVEVSLDDSITKFSKLIDPDYEFFTYKKLLRAKQQIREITCDNAGEKTGERVFATSVR